MSEAPSEPHDGDRTNKETSSIEKRNQNMFASMSDINFAATSTAN